METYFQSNNQHTTAVGKTNWDSPLWSPLSSPCSLTHLTYHFFSLSCLIAFWKWLPSSYTWCLLFQGNSLHSRKNVTRRWSQGPSEPVLEPLDASPNDLSAPRRRRRVTRLHQPWFLSTAAAAAKSLQSYTTLCNPIDGSPPGSPIPGILQERTLEWVAISFSNAGKWKVKVNLLSRVRVRLVATPWTAAYQAPPPMGFSSQE